MPLELTYCCLGLHFEMALVWIRTEHLFYDPGTRFFKAISSLVFNQFHLPSCIPILFLCTFYDQSHLCLLTDQPKARGGGSRAEL